MGGSCRFASEDDRLPGTDERACDDEAGERNGQDERNNEFTKDALLSHR